MLIAAVLCSCGKSTVVNDSIKSDSIQTNSSLQVDLFRGQKPTSDSFPVSKEATVRREKREPQELITRMIEFPSDRHFNGQHLIYQLDLEQKIFSANQDTLLSLAKSYYILAENTFPVSIADNFDQGISTEHIHFPVLRIDFWLYDSKYDEEPYAKKVVSVSGDHERKVSSSFE